jgi:hypothetical protein
MYYCSTQIRFTTVNFDGSHYANFILMVKYCITLDECTNTRHFIFTPPRNYTLPYQNFTSPAINTVHATSTSITQPYLASSCLWGPSNGEQTARSMTLLRQSHTASFCLLMCPLNEAKIAEIRIMYKETNRGGGGGNKKKIRTASAALSISNFSCCY